MLANVVHSACLEPGSLSPVPSRHSHFLTITDYLRCGDMQLVQDLSECMTLEELHRCAAAWRTGPTLSDVVRFPITTMRCVQSCLVLGLLHLPAAAGDSTML